MFGFGKKKASSDDLAMMLISEAFDSINGLSLFFARNLEGFFDDVNSNRVNDFLNEHGFEERDRMFFTSVYSLAVLKILLEWSRENDGPRIFMSCLLCLDQAAKNNRIDLNIETINREIEMILRSNERFQDRRELYSGQNYFDQGGIYFQISNYLFKTHLAKNSKINQICAKNERDYQVALFNCLNRIQKSAGLIFSKYRVA